MLWLQQLSNHTIKSLKLLTMQQSYNKAYQYYFLKNLFKEYETNSFDRDYRYRRENELIHFKSVLPGESLYKNE